MKKILCLLLAVLMIFTLAGCSKLSRLENRMDKKVETMLNALEAQDLGYAEKQLHPTTGKESEAVKEGLQEMLALFEGKKIESFALIEARARKQNWAEHIVKGTASVTLDDGTVYRITYRYLDDGDTGFDSFKVQGHGVS